MCMRTQYAYNQRPLLTATLTRRRPAAESSNDREDDGDSGDVESDIISIVKYTVQSGYIPFDPGCHVVY